MLPLGCVMQFNHDGKLLFTVLSMLSINLFSWVANQYTEWRGKTSRRFEGIKNRIVYIWVIVNAFSYEIVAMMRGRCGSYYQIRMLSSLLNCSDFSQVHLGERHHFSLATLR